MTANELKERLWRIESDELRADIERGIDLMARFKGDNWPDLVEPEALSLESCFHCVVGQTFECSDFRSYQDALLNMGLSSSRAHEFGFDIQGSMEDDNRITYAELNDAWRTIFSEVY